MLGDKLVAGIGSVFIAVTTGSANTDRKVRNESHANKNSTMKGVVHRMKHCMENQVRIFRSQYDQYG